MGYTLCCDKQPKCTGSLSPFLFYPIIPTLVFLLSHLLLQLLFLVPFWPAFVLAAHREGEQGKSQSRGFLQHELQSCCVKCRRMMWET